MVRSTNPFRYFDSSPEVIRLVEDHVKINGEMRYLWRAVDHEGEVLESHVTATRDKAATLSFIKRAMKRPGAALKEIGNVDGQETGRWLNNRAENSHLTFRLSAVSTNETDSGFLLAEGFGLIAVT